MILPSSEMSVAAVVASCNPRQRAQLNRRQQPIGDRNPQHRCVPLNVEAISKPQVLELLVVELAAQESARLVAKLRDALVDEGVVDRIVSIHGRYSSRRALSRPITTRHVLITVRTIV